jgi:hypothetical protein
MKSTPETQRETKGNEHRQYVALVCIVISIIFALVTSQAINPLWCVLLAIFAVSWWGARGALGHLNPSFDHRGGQSSKSGRGIL